MVSVSTVTNRHEIYAEIRRRVSSLKIKVFEPIVFPVIVCECETVA
jgi:hypothetical protein